jgi:hypothetical protein
MAETTEQPAGGRPSKSDAVRQILKEGGKKTPPAEIVAQARERFGVEMTPDYAAKTRSRILAEGRKKPGKKPAKTEAAPAEPTAPSAPSQPVAAADGGAVVLLEDVRAVEGLIERIGAEELLRMIGVMSR